MIATLLFAAAVANAPPDCAALVASAKPAIDHANGDWVRSVKAGDAAALAAAYSDDGLLVLPDGSVVTGRAAVEAFYARQSARAASITDGGGQGVLRRRGDDGPEQESRAAYLTVWKRVGGAWKIVRNLTF